MMPLSMTNTGILKKIVKISGRDKTKKFLESLGFVEGAEVTVVSELAGNLIVNVKNSRVALDKAMASRIFV